MVFLASLSADYNALLCGRASFSADHNALRCEEPRFETKATTTTTIEKFYKHNKRTILYMYIVILFSSFDTSSGECQCMMMISLQC